MLRVVALALLLPGLASADQSVLAQAGPPPSAPAPATDPAPGPAEDPATGSAPAAPAAPAPAATPAAAPAPTPAKKEPQSWVVLKGGWFGSSDDYEGESFEGSSEWEIAVGSGRGFGLEVGTGYMETSAGDVDVETIPLLLTLRLGIPIAMVVPHLDLGGGLYFNQIDIRNQDLEDWTLGWHAGLGCDVLLGRLVVGADFRYMGIAPTFSTVGTITLDRYAALLKAGVRF